MNILQNTKQFQRAFQTLIKQTVRVKYLKLDLQVCTRI